MPFLVDSTLAGNVWDSVWTPSTDQANSDVTSDGLLIDVLATPIPKGLPMINTLSFGAG